MLQYVIAQATTPDGLGGLIATYGPFAPFAALTLWLLRLLWEENKTKDVRIENLTETAMDKIVPLVLEATGVLGEAVEALGVVRDQQPDVSRIQELLEELKREVLSLREDAESHGPGANK